MYVRMYRQLESEVEWAKEVADRLERVNQSLLQVRTHILIFTRTVRGYVCMYVHVMNRTIHSTNFHSYLHIYVHTSQSTLKMIRIFII
jgi:hypothetical protein